MGWEIGVTRENPCFFFILFYFILFCFVDVPRAVCPACARHQGPEATIRAAIEAVATHHSVVRNRTRLCSKIAVGSLRALLYS